MRLVEIILREIGLPLHEAFSTSAGTTEIRRVLLLTLRDADGLEVWSECAALELPTYLPETLGTAWLALSEWLIPRVLGQSFSRPEDAATVLGQGIRGHHMAQAALESGFWALDASRQGTCLAKRLGGTRSEVAAGIALGLQPTTEQLIDRVREARAAGYRRIKLKVEPETNLKVLRAVGEELVGSLPWSVDANGSYAATPERVKELDTLGFSMIEQPLAWDDLAAHARLQAELRTDICLDESVTSLGRAREMIWLAAGRILCLKPGRVGGLSQAVAIHDLCADARTPLWCGGMLETGIGRAYNVALASLPGFSLPSDLSPSQRYWQQDVVEPEWTMNPHGFVQVPDEPGLGVAINRHRIEDLTLRLKRFRAR